MGESENADQTLYDNLYSTKILPTWTDTKVEDALQGGYRDYTILLNDENVNDFASTTKSGWKGRVNYALSEYNEEKGRELATRNEFYRDPNRMLEITITTIILMAIGQIVSKENVMYTELYLRNIRDRYGDHPKNIGKFLKYLVSVKRENEINWGDRYYSDPPATLQITKITNPSRIPVRKE